MKIELYQTLNYISTYCHSIQCYRKTLECSSIYFANEFVESNKKVELCIKMSHMIWLYNYNALT